MAGEESPGLQHDLESTLSPYFPYFLSYLPTFLPSRAYLPISTTKPILMIPKFFFYHIPTTSTHISDPIPIPDLLHVVQ